MIRRPVDTVTGSSSPLAVEPPVVERRLNRAVTVAAAIVLLAFVAVVAVLMSSHSRLDELEDADASLALVVGNTMDIRFVVERQPAWERRLSELLMNDRAEDLAQAIAWYEELTAHVRDPAVEFQLGILEGEAGRLERLRAQVDAWDIGADPYPMMAAAIRSAYLGGDSDVPDDAGRELPAEGHRWFAEQLALRIALRAGDRVRATAVLDARAARTQRLAWRVRALATVEIVLLAIGIVGAAALVRRARQPRLGDAPLPPPWPGLLGAAVLIRGAAVQVLLLVGLWALSQAASDAVVDALSWPWSNLFFLPMLLLARHHLMRPHGLTIREAFGFTLARGSWGRLAFVVMALVGLGLAGDWVTGTIAGYVGRTGHWAEWFDEDLVWGSWNDVALSAVSAVVAAPFFEEIVFRGLLFATLRRRYGVLVSAVTSAAIFAVLHGYGWAGLGSVLWSGVLWAWGYERTRSLVPGMLAHAVVNLLATLGLVLLLRP